MSFRQVAFTPFRGQDLPDWWSHVDVHGEGPQKRIRDVLQPLMGGKNNASRVTQPDLQAAFLDEAVDFFMKGVASLYASHVLLRDGHHSWASISCYYSSFYGINSLLRLQGRAITHFNDRSLYFICPERESTQTYLVSKDRLNPGEHLNHWEFFYRLYFSFDPPSPFEQITRSNALEEDVREETTLRNTITYNPFSYVEFGDSPLQSESVWGSVGPNGLLLEDFLKGLCTDPYQMYFARAGLRLMLAKRLLDQICPEPIWNDSVQPRLTKLRNLRTSLHPSANLRESGVAWRISAILEPEGLESTDQA